MDAVGVQLPEATNARISLGRRERARVLRGLAHDQDEAVAGPDGDRLVSGGVAGRRQDAHTARDLAIALDRLVSGAGKVDPLPERMVPTPRHRELVLLNDDRHARKGAVLAA